MPEGIETISSIGDGLYPFDIMSSSTDLASCISWQEIQAINQEAADRHLSEYRLSTMDLESRGALWLLAAVAIRVLAPLPVWRDQIWLRTWGQETKGIRCRRHSMLYCGEPREDRVFALINSEWFLADGKTHRPLRPRSVLSADELACLTNPKDVIDFEPLKLRVLDEALRSPRYHRPLFRRKVEYGEIDRNAHLNNTHYLSYIISALEAYIHDAGYRELYPLLLQSLDLSFLAEVFLGEEIEVRLEQDEEITPFRFADGKRECTALRAWKLRLEGFNPQQNKSCFRAEVLAGFGMVQERGD